MSAPASVEAEAGAGRHAAVRSGAPRQKEDGALAWVGRVLSWLALLVTVGVLLATVVVPRVTGATAYTVLTGSMRPGLPPGELVVMRPVPSDSIGVGTVITYQIASGEGAVVTHRVIATAENARGERTFVTQGDANTVADQEPVREVQVRGALWYHLPWLGYLNSALTGPQRGIATIVAVALLGGYALTMFGGAALDRRRRSRRAS